MKTLKVELEYTQSPGFPFPESPWKCLFIRKPFFIYFAHTSNYNKSHLQFITGNCYRLQKRNKKDKVDKNTIVYQQTYWILLFVWIEHKMNGIFSNNVVVGQTSAYKLCGHNSYMHHLRLIHEQDSISLPMNKHFHGFSKEGSSLGRVHKGDDTKNRRRRRPCFLHTSPPVVFRESYSFTGVNRTHVWNSRKFKQVYCEEPINLIIWTDGSFVHLRFLKTHLDLW